MQNFQATNIQQVKKVKQKLIRIIRKWLQSPSISFFTYITFWRRFQIECKFTQGTKYQKLIKIYQKMRMDDHQWPKQIIHYFRGYYCIFSELMFIDVVCLIIFIQQRCDSMCFLKALKPLDEITLDQDSSTEESSTQQHPKNFPFDGCIFSPTYSFKASQVTRQQKLLAELMGCVRANSARLACLHQKLSQNEHYLLNSQLELEYLSTPGVQASSVTKPHHISPPQRQDRQHSAPTHPLVSKLFGQKDYEYHLELQGEIPSTIFKERNINIPLRLVDRNGQKILNSNITHLCLGVCDAHGQWVSENRVGEPFMKGKTEVEMYHGEGSFLKVYPREISRHFPEGKLNFVVYSKPSLLQFSNNVSNVQKIVESQQIQPLIIADIQIKAKKC